MSVARGFSLIELLVVIGIVAVLIGILLPALSRGIRTAKTVECLSNLRQLQTAHVMYMDDHQGRFVDVGLAHGGAHGDETATWIKTLNNYWSAGQDSGLGREIQSRSPLDDSPHWPGGTPVPGTTDQFRRTSYGVNDYLTRFGAPASKRRLRLDEIRQPATLVHAMLMTYTGPFAGADHTHISQWFASGDDVEAIAAEAAFQVQINAAGGPPGVPASVSNYGFLDGHAATLPFRSVYPSRTHNKLDPTVAN